MIKGYGFDKKKILHGKRTQYIDCGAGYDIVAKCILPSKLMAPTRAAALFSRNSCLRNKKDDVSKDLMSAESQARVVVINHVLRERRVLVK